MKNIDKYAYYSQLRFINPQQKVLFVLITLGICLFADSILLFVVITLFMGYLTVCKGKTPLLLFCKLMCIPLTFLVLSIIAVIFQITKQEELLIYSFSLGSIHIGVTTASLLSGKILFFKVLASVSCLYTLCLSTPMTDIFMVLEHIKCPSFLIEIMSLIYRFIFILIDTAYTMQNAQASRLGYRSFRTSLKSLGLLFSTLLIRSLKINDNLYIALESRGYHNNLKVLNDTAYYTISYFKILGTTLLFIILLLCDKWLF
ncbi:MAG: cobalt ECF transporter T component CbiQ [Cellulosilyticaceae bacterium]